MTDGVTIIAGVPIPVHVSPLLVGCRLSRLAWARLHGRRHCRNVQRQRPRPTFKFRDDLTSTQPF